MAVASANVAVPILAPHYGYAGQTSHQVSYQGKLQNRLISSGIESVLGHTEKSYTASYYRQFSTNIKVYNHKIKTSIFSPFLLPLKANKTGLNFILFILISAESCL